MDGRLAASKIDLAFVKLTAAPPDKEARLFSFTLINVRHGIFAMAS